MCLRPGVGRYEESVLSFFFTFVIFSFFFMGTLRLWPLLRLNLLTGRYEGLVLFSTLS